jgi:phage-related protein
LKGIRPGGIIWALTQIRGKFMTIETFTWKIQAWVTCAKNQYHQAVQFGDGYTQVSGNGLNSETLTFDFRSGKAETALEIFNFLRGIKQNHSRFSHRLAISLMACQADSLQKFVKKKQITIIATFEQAFAP